MTNEGQAQPSHGLKRRLTLIAAQESVPDPSWSGAARLRRGGPLLLLVPLVSSLPLKGPIFVHPTGKAWPEGCLPNSLSLLSFARTSPPPEALCTRTSHSSSPFLPQPPLTLFCLTSSRSCPTSVLDSPFELSPDCGLASPSDAPGLPAYPRPLDAASNRSLILPFEPHCPPPPVLHRTQSLILASILSCCAP